MPVRIRDKNNIPKLLKETKNMDGKKITVGIMGDNELSMIGAVHEFGAHIPVTPKMRAWFAAQGYPLRATTTHINIPERSFIRSGFDQSEKKFFEDTKKVLFQAFEKQAPTDTVLDALGLQLKGMIQTYMRDLSRPPLSQMTIDMTGRSNPLVNTGKLLEAIVHEVE